MRHERKCAVADQRLALGSDTKEPGDAKRRGAHSMGDDVGLANDLAFRLRQHLADQGLDAALGIDEGRRWEHSSSSC